MTTAPTKPLIRRGMKPKIPRRRLIGIVSVIFIALLLFGTIPRIFQLIQLNRTHHQLVSSIRSSQAIIVQPSPEIAMLSLPGDTQALQQIPILARADGYLEKRLVDIGDRVKKGQLLAVINAPDLDEQLNQGKADLRTQQANLSNAKATYVHFIAAWHSAEAAVLQTGANVGYDRVEIKRYDFLAKQGAVSVEIRDSFLRQLRSDEAALVTNQENARAAKLQADAALEAVRAAQQTVDSFNHNMLRLAALKGFENVYAPYDGVITARYIDAGNLIQSGGAGTQILAMGSLDVLRVFVQVPQTVFRSMQAGSRADVIVPEFPNRVFPGIVTNVSGGLDSQSRTLQVEVHIDNRDHVLPTGVYVEVRFRYPDTIKTTTIPVNAISTRASGNYAVAVVNGRAQFRAIDIFRDHGPTIETSQGLRAGDVILLDPPDDLKENEPIHAVLFKPSASPS
jgi:RND family efflux transporter MFP subunit